MEISWFAFNLELDLSLPKNYITSEIPRTPEMDADPDVNPPVLPATTTEKNNTTFQINNTKIYVPVATFSIKDAIKLKKKHEARI